MVKHNYTPNIDLEWRFVSKIVTIQYKRQWSWYEVVGLGKCDNHILQKQWKYRRI